MKILAIAATNHKDSINKKLLHYVASIMEDDVEIVDLIKYELPFYRQDREETDGIPQAAQEFYTKIGKADALIVSYAEHNGGYTAVYKNLFDWMSRIDRKVFHDKPSIIMSASPGPKGGASVLGTAETSAPFFGMDLKAKVSVPNFQDNYDDENQKISNKGIILQIKNAVVALK